MDIVQELSVIYGVVTAGSGTPTPTVSGITLGSGSPFAIHGITIREENFTEATINIVVDIASGAAGSGTEVPFVDLLKQLFDAFQQPEQALQIKQKGTIRRTYDGFTGFDIQPQIRRAQDPMNTGRSGRYEISMRVGLPGNRAGRKGRRSATADVQFSGSRVKRIVISGTYTAVPPGTSARTQYDQEIDAFGISILDLFGGESIYKLAEEPQTIQNDTNKTLDFTRIFEQIIHDYGGASDPDIRNEVITISRLSEGPGDSGGVGARRLVRLRAIYSASVDADVTLDLQAKWNSVKSSVLARIQEVLGGGAIAVESEEPLFTDTGNTIAATLTVLGAETTGVLEYVTTFVTDDSGPDVVVPVWVGDPLAVHKYVGIRILLVTKEEVYRSFILLDTPFLVLNSVHVRSNQRITPKILGQFGDPHLSVIEVTRTRTFRVVNVVTGAGAGGTFTSLSPPAGGGGGAGGDGAAGAAQQQFIQQGLFAAGIGGFFTPGGVVSP